MAKRVVWTITAKKARRNILEYWIKRNKSNSYSKKLNQIFIETADLISKHPKIGKQTELTGIRYKVVRDYLFTYRETKKSIEVLTIWDSRQDPENFDRIIKIENA